MKRYFSFGLLIAITISLVCGQVDFLKKINSGNPRLIKGIHQIPFELFGHKIYIKTRINTTNTFNFILDTGTITAIDIKTAETLQLEPGINLPSPDAKNKSSLSKQEMSISIGSVCVDNFVPVIADLPEAAAGEPEIAGFLGSNYLRFFCVTIDYQKKILTISTEKSSFDSSCYQIKLYRHIPLGFPLIKGLINEKHEVTMMIDTGSPFEIVAPLSMIEKSEIFMNQKVIKSNGAFMKWPFTETNHNYLALAESIRIQELEINHFPLYFAELPPIFDGPLLGKAFLDHFTIHLDFPENEIYFCPNGLHFKQNLLSVGIGIKKESEKTVVQGVWQNSPADRNNIKVGDEILEINGKKTKDISVGDITVILENDYISEVELKLKKGESIRVIKLKKKKLL